MKEADIVRAILRYLKTVPGCFAWKEHGGMYGTAGIPDIIACIGGRFYGFEVKTDTGKPTKLQEATIRKILNSGGTALVVRSVNEVRAAIEPSAINNESENNAFDETKTQRDNKRRNRRQ